jgi:hypothetical protein
MSDSIAEVHKDIAEQLEELYQDSGLGKCDECKNELEEMRLIGNKQKEQ